MDRQKLHINIKLCLRGAYTARTRLLFHRCDLDIKPMTLKLGCDLDILKIYLETENELASLMHSKLLTVDHVCMANEIQK